MADASGTTHDDAPAAAAKKRADRETAIPRDESSVAARSVLINRPRQEIYAFWRDQRNLATVMENIRSIAPIDDRRWHWVVAAPGGRTVEWDAVVTDDRPGSLLAWESEDGADVRNSGWVEFRDAPGGHGTYVTATIAYDPPLGAVGKLFAKLFQREPAIQSRRDLRRLKQFLETGEIATAARTRAQLDEERN